MPTRQACLSRSHYLSNSHKECSGSAYVIPGVASPGVSMLLILLTFIRITSFIALIICFIIFLASISLTSFFIILSICFEFNIFLLVPDVETYFNDFTHSFISKLGILCYNFYSLHCVNCIPYNMIAVFSFSCGCMYFLF